MSTVPAADRLAALEGNVLIAVTAFVMDSTGVGVDDSRVLGAGLRGVILLGRHFGCMVECNGDVWVL
jgi:hypothetical protein